MTETNLIESLRKMRCGETMVYHTGELGHDADLARVNGDDSIRDLQRAMLQAGTQRGASVYGLFGEKPVMGLGLGHLTQKRLAPYKFEYRFTRNGT